MGKLADEVVVVSGGSRGMGAAHVRMLIYEGAKVVIGDVLEEEGQGLAAELGQNCQFEMLDVRRPNQWSSVVARAEANFGPVTGLINNAGITGWRSVEDATLEEFQNIVDVNLVGVFNGTQAVIASMRKAGRGCIVNVSSTAGLIAYRNNAGYVASKWGVRGLTKASALDLAQYSIRVVSIHPGPINETFMARHAKEENFGHQPIPRKGELEEVSKLVLFLLADATYSTGSEWLVDGGAILVGPSPIGKRD